MKSYENGGYSEGMNPYDTYHSWAGSQYREKVRSSFTLVMASNHYINSSWTQSSPESHGRRLHSPRILFHEAQ